MFELLREGQKEAVAGFVKDGILHIASFDFSDIQEINKLYKQIGTKPKVSLTDCSVWYYAKQNNYVLLTGDRKLRNSALNEGVEVRGVIYVFDKLVNTGAIPLDIASEKLVLLKEKNPRLPQDEIEKRLRQWRGDQNKKGGNLYLTVRESCFLYFTKA